MAVKIGRGVRSALASGQAFLQVRGGDHDVVWDVICDVHTELKGDPDAEDDTTITWRGEEVDWIEWEGDVLDLPDGPGWFIDVTTWPEGERFSVAEVLAERLAAAGVADATIGVPTPAHTVERAAETYAGPGVIGYAHYQVQPEALPDDWVYPVLPDQWVEHALAWTAQVARLSLYGTGLPDIWVPPANAASLAKRLHPHSPQLYLVTDTGTNFVRTAVLVGTLLMPYLVEGVGGGLSPEQLAGEARRIAEMLLGLDPRPVNAAVRFVPAVYAPNYFWVDWEMTSDTGDDLLQFGRSSDLVVPDAYWWQLLGPGHRDRLGGWPPGAQVIDNGQAAVVTFGRPEQWADPATYADVQALARQTLAPLIAHTNMDTLRARHGEH